MRKEEKHLLRNFIPPLLFVLLLWIIKGFEIYERFNFSKYGLLPRNFSALTGVVTFPLIHGDWDHLISNSAGLLVLGFLLFTFHRDIAYRVVIQIWLLHGIWLWLGGRTTYHIGASGIIYGLASFLFFTGVFKKEKTTMTISLLVVFLYGSMVWGLMPFLQGISWEGHLFGGAAGLLMAWQYRKIGIQKPVYDWEKEEEEIIEEYWKEGEEEKIENSEEDKPIEPKQSATVHYIYQPKSDNNDVKN
jgi:membrane associated rhomboid family serine protease